MTSSRGADLDRNTLYRKLVQKTQLVHKQVPHTQLGETDQENEGEKNVTLPVSLNCRNEWLVKLHKIIVN